MKKLIACSGTQSFMRSAETVSSTSNLALHTLPRKIVINTCYGGFSLSDKVINRYRQATGSVLGQDNEFFETDIARDDPVLIRIIEEIGVGAASGAFASLKIIEIPSDIPVDGWTIQEYDGVEWVAEKHRTWS